MYVAQFEQLEDMRPAFKEMQNMMTNFFLNVIICFGFIAIMFNLAQNSPAVKIMGETPERDLDYTPQSNEIIFSSN